MTQENIDSLIARALDAQASELKEESKNPEFETLVNSQSSDVHRKAVNLLLSPQRQERLLGVRILSELGRPEMPFADASVEAMISIIESETDVDLLRWEVSALGNQHRASTLPTLLALADHSDPSIRDAVAGAISQSTTGSELDDKSIVVLARLAQDPDDEVRFSSVFELAAWWDHGVRDPRVGGALKQATRDANARVARTASDCLGRE
jgi:hypothetical protein